MSKIKNGELDQYGAEPFKQQQFGTAGVEGVNCIISAGTELTQQAYSPAFCLSVTIHTAFRQKIDTEVVTIQRKLVDFVLNI